MSIHRSASQPHSLKCYSKDSPENLSVSQNDNLVETLPQEIVLMIAHLLPLYALSRYEIVSKKLYHILNKAQIKRINSALLDNGVNFKANQFIEAYLRQDAIYATRRTYYSLSKWVSRKIKLSDSNSFDGKAFFQSQHVIVIKDKQVLVLKNEDIKLGAFSYSTPQSYYSFECTTVSNCTVLDNYRLILTDHSSGEATIKNLQDTSYSVYLTFPGMQLQNFRCYQFITTSKKIIGIGYENIVVWKRDGAFSTLYPLDGKDAGIYVDYAATDRVVCLISKQGRILKLNFRNHQFTELQQDHGTEIDYNKTWYSPVIWKNTYLLAGCAQDNWIHVWNLKTHTQGRLSYKGNHPWYEMQGKPLNEKLYPITNVHHSTSVKALCVYGDLLLSACSNNKNRSRIGLWDIAKGIFLMDFQVSSTDDWKNIFSIQVVGSIMWFVTEMGVYGMNLHETWFQDYELSN